MKHLFTISLVFFSLTHLAQAEQRMVGMRLVAEAYCNKQQDGIAQSALSQQQVKDQNKHLFLSYNDLALSGVLTDEQTPMLSVATNVTAYLTIGRNAKNNSP